MRATHGWLGLVAGALFGTLGLTGAILVFGMEISRVTVAEMSSTLASPGLSLRELVSIAEAAEPSDRRATAIAPALRARDVATVSFSPSYFHYHPDRLDVLLDPVSGDVIRQHVYGQQPIPLLFRLHAHLFLQDSGFWIVSIAALLLVLTSLGGLYLWWPTRRAKVHLCNAPSSGRLLFDWHRFIGVVFALPVVLASVTGIFVALPQYFTFLGGPHYSAFAFAPEPRASMWEGDIGPDAAARTASAAFPEAELLLVRMPEGTGFYHVVLRQPGEPRKQFGGTRIAVDASNGDVLAVRDPLRFPKGASFLEWQYPLHTGEIFGIAGRVFMLLGGVALPALLVTGALRWYRRRLPRGSR